MRELYILKMFDYIRVTRALRNYVYYVNTHCCTKPKNGSHPLIEEEMPTSGYPLSWANLSAKSSALLSLLPRF